LKRVPTAELLDTDSGTPQEIAQSLADLRQINRRFGGVSTTQAMIEHVAGVVQARSLSLLEVAAGAGDTPHLVQQALRARGIHLEVTLLDRAATHLNHRRPGNGLPAVAADALELPFRDGSFDLVGCNLFVHHLSPDEVVRFAGEALRVSRAAALINDLVRSPLHLALVYAGMPLYHSRITRHDAVASIRQAYTPDEMRAMLAQAGAAEIEICRHFLFRMGIVAWKHVQSHRENVAH